MIGKGFLHALNLVKLAKEARIYLSGLGMLQYKVVDLLKDIICISPIIVTKDSIFSHCFTSAFLGVSLGSIPAGNGLRHDTDQQVDKQQMTRTMHWDHVHAFMILASSNTCCCIVATPQTRTNLVAFGESQVDCILPGTCNFCNSLAYQQASMLHPNLYMTVKSLHHL